MLNFMDLSRQVKNHKSEYMKAIENVVDDTAFSGGKYVKAFEKKFADYIGADYCSALNSGTSALFMAMKAIGINSGDEVIVPATTFIASAWGAFYCGAKPVFVECNEDNWEIDPYKIEEKITKNTKAIVAVHLYGMPFDFDAVKAVANKYSLPVIEDCAQAHGAKYKGKKVGTLGDLGCFSFYPGKNLGAFGEAGAVVTNNKLYYQKIEMMKNHGSDRRYYHDIEGYNLRMDGIQGAILSTKLQYLDTWNQKRREIATEYFSKIKNDKIKLQEVPAYAEPVFHLFEIEVDNVESFMKNTESKGIGCGRHYPLPCHLQQVFSCYGYKKGDLPISEYHADHCVSLPMFPEMTNEEIQKVIDICNEY